jgi:hypothetical protein
MGVIWFTEFVNCLNKRKMIVSDFETACNNFVTKGTPARFRRFQQPDVKNKRPLSHEEKGKRWS